MSLTHLCERNSLKPLQLDLCGSTFPCIPNHICHFPLLWEGKSNNGKGTEPISTLPSPEFSLKGTLRPPHITLIPCQSKIHETNAPFHISACHWRNVYLVFWEKIPMCTHLVLISILIKPVLFIACRHHIHSSHRGAKGDYWWRKSKCQGMQPSPSTVHLVELDHLDQGRRDGGVREEDTTM